MSIYELVAAWSDDSGYYQTSSYSSVLATFSSREEAEAYLAKHRSKRTGVLKGYSTADFSIKKRVDDVPHDPK